MKKFVNFLTCFIFILLLTGISANNIFAFSAGPPDGRTGSPADGGDTCNASGCHNTYTLNSGTLNFSITAPSDYTTGAVEDIEISFDNTNTDMAMFGFELSALDANDNHVGSFSTVDDMTQVSGDYIKHTMEGHDHMGTASWQVQWTAPSSATDPVTFYASGNECSGDGSPADDYIYTASKSISVAGADVDPSADIKANNSDGPVTIAEGDDLAITLSLDPGSYTGNADWWLIVNTPSGLQYYDIAQGAFVSTPTVFIQYSLVTINDYPIYNTSDLESGTYTYFFACDLDMDGELDLDDFYYDSVTVTVTGISFKNDILPLFSSTDGAGAWFNYGDGGETYGPNTACGTCHAGEFEDDDGEESCPPGCHGMDLNSHEGWLAGMDGGMMALLGESSVGATDYKWDMSMLKMRLRNNRMPPGMPFMIDEGNRDGGIVALTADCDADDITLTGSQFCVTRSTTTDEDGEDILEVVYSAKDVDTDFDAIGLLSAYVDSLSGTPTTYAGSPLPVTFADVAGLFSQPNVWYNGGLACTACHYCDEEPPCFHEIDFRTQAGLLAGMDGGMMTLLGESSVGEIDYDWDGSSLRARLRNSRMPPNAPIDVHELTRDGAMVIHPITGAEVRAVELIEEWVEDGAKDN